MGDGGSSGSSSSLTAIISVAVAVVVVLVFIAVGSNTVQRVAETPGSVSCCDVLIVTWTVVLYYLIWTPLTIAYYAVIIFFCVTFIVLIVAAFIISALGGGGAAGGGPCYCHNGDSSLSSMFKFPVSFAFHGHASAAIGRVCGGGYTADDYARDRRQHNRPTAPLNSHPSAAPGVVYGIAAAARPPSVMPGTTRYDAVQPRMPGVVAAYPAPRVAVVQGVPVTGPPQPYHY